MKNTNIIVLLLTLLAFYLMYQNDAEWYWYLVFLAIAGLVISAIDDTEKKKLAAETDEKKLSEIGIDTSKFIKLGNYIGGHPDLNNFLQNVRAFPANNSLELFVTFHDDKSDGSVHETVKQAEIPLTNISNITIEDHTSIEKRVSVGRLMLFGPLALGMRKTQRTEEAYLCVAWNDGRFSHETLFSLPTLEKANVSRNELIKLCKKETAILNEKGK